MSCCDNSNKKYIPNAVKIDLPLLQDLRQPVCEKCDWYRKNNYNESFCRFIPKPPDEDSCLVGYTLKYNRVNLDYLWGIPYAECPRNKWYKIVETVLGVSNAI